MTVDHVKPTVIPDYAKFIFGGFSGVTATLIMQPLDLLKNRMQLSGEGGTKRIYKNSIHAVTSIVKSEGLVGLYAGLSAGLLRQALYTTSRMGIYQSLLEKFSSEQKQPIFIVKVGFGVFAGAIASYLATPSEVALIRMMADGRLPVNERRGYKNVFNAIYRICTEESVLTLWKGATPTIVRAMVVNGAQFATYSQAKQFFLANNYCNEGVFLHFYASLVSGFVTTITSMPVDIVKTRIQNSKKSVNSPSKGAWTVFFNTIKQEGFFSLWKGITPYYGRVGPHTILVFVVFEQLCSFYKKFYSS